MLCTCCGLTTHFALFACWQSPDKCEIHEQEKTELEEQRVALVGEVQSYRKKIKQLEDDLLFRLSNSQARPSSRQAHPQQPVFRSLPRAT